MTPVELAFTAEGPQDAPALLFASSIGTTRAMWDPQAAALSDHFRVIRFDHRGHGASPVPPGPYDLEDLGGDVVALLDRLGIERAHLCGVSLGGMVGMWLGAHAPELVDRLVLCCTSARLGPPEMWAQRAQAVREGGMEAVADAVVARWLTPAYAQAHPERLATLRTMLLSSPPEGYANCCGAIERMDLEPVLGRIGAPTLVIGGAEDRATPPEHQERIAAAIPGARLELLSPAAHVATYEQPQAATRLIAAHLT